MDSRHSHHDNHYRRSSSTPPPPPPRRRSRHHHSKNPLPLRTPQPAPPPYLYPCSTTPPQSPESLLSAHSKNATYLLSTLRPFSPPDSPLMTSFSPPPPYSPSHPHLLLDHDKLTSAPPIPSDIFTLQPSAALTLLARSVEYIMTLPQYPPSSTVPSAITKKFYSKTSPEIPIEGYLFRLHRYCPLSTAVYLAASHYLHKVVLQDRIVPLTPKTAHRLLLAALRVATKTLEDLQHSHERFAGVGGCTGEELRRLEIAFCYAIDFDLRVDRRMLEEQSRNLRSGVERMVNDMMIR